MVESCSLRFDSDSGYVEIIDQTLLPHQLVWRRLESLQEYLAAIASMQVRGAPLIGITAAYGVAHALRLASSDDALSAVYAQLLATRPTAVNLRWALDVVHDAVLPLPPEQRPAAAFDIAHRLRREDIHNCSLIGEHGLALLRPLQRKGAVLNIMTHCNAGWLATIQWGTALAPIYKAHAAGIDVHVWVSETRPRNQGLNLTAWELQRSGVPYTVVADNSCGYLLSQGQVDAVIVGSDRTAANGDVCNKVGTYLKALAASAHAVPFFVALPCSTIDWRCNNGDEIPIEERSAGELLSVCGPDVEGVSREIRLAAHNTPAFNPAFDVTPARLVTRLITEAGSVEASAQGLMALR
tara:strand:+ start:408505 stop:409563 length:1059 start_codon:yes stop_codon:yes gene_type:complete